MKCRNIKDKIQKNKQKANNKFRINNIKKQELKEQGVTMLSLVVTIVILLILSGITIKFALNDNGVIKQSKLASEKYKNSTIQEQAALNEVAKEMSTASSSSGTSGGSSSGGNTDELMQQIEILQDQVDMLNNQIDDLKTKQATGNATTSQVLSGATFSTSAGIGLTGTMKNNGAWTANTTGNGNITIPEGYHNGKGYVSGAGAYNKGVSDADARVNTNSASYKSGYTNGAASQQIIDMGAGMSFDIKSKFPSTYQSFTANNFIIDIIDTGKLSFYSGNAPGRQVDLSWNEGTVKKIISYDATSGILTAYMEVYNDVGFNGQHTTTKKCNVHLYVVS